MTDSPVNLILYNPVTWAEGGGFAQTVTDKLKSSWRRSIRDIGGYWLAYANWDGEPWEMLDLFQTGMLMEIRETTGGMITWQGFLSEMSLVYKGARYTRSWAMVANKVKVIYSKMGENLLTNPGCESAVWDAYGTPSTRERSTTWASQGTYSAHVVVDAANEGVKIQEPITISTSKQYQARVSVKIVSGTWRLEVYTDQVIDYSEQATAGQYVLYAGVGEGDGVTSVGLRLYCVDATGECYADAAVFQEIASRAETGWYENTKSQDEYGTIEYIISEVGMTDAAANALAEKTLNDMAWANIKPPTQIEQYEREIADRLDLVFVGYAFTLKSYYTEYNGSEDTCSALITDIIGDAEFVDAARIQTNSLNYLVEDINQYRAWDLLRDITQAGDADGDRWTCGVYADRKLYYEQASDTPVARIRNGKILAQHGGPLEGWLAEPGLVALDDMLIAYDIGDREEDQLNKAWMSEVEFSLGEYLLGGDGIVYRQAVA